MASLGASNLGESRLTRPCPDTPSRAPLLGFSQGVTLRRRHDVTTLARAVAAGPVDVAWRASKPGEQSSSVSMKKLDDWIFRSVTGIVRDLRQAPLFVHVYRNGDREDGDVSLVVEKSVKEENWEKVKGEWEKGERETPEGVIFVEELEAGYDRDEVGVEESGGRDGGRVWGLVAQGRGGKRGTAVCYLLKTSRVGSGTGVWSTHFRLVRVKGFRESARSQLISSWLCDR
ncbi:hypothetical protein MLD38_009716 [Melastoma candidum]|uniref:Uncharacterized protein n=1 Tax=Melastoma candidum TaxID=119954 RepID=A0ACB9RY54_9MYRT|nr:hypothetical protein MLD38_009716 [Melastoma candidum]